MPHTITVGLDGSPESLAAADWAAREALLREVPLRLVHAGELPLHAYIPFAGEAVPPPGADRSAHLLREVGTALRHRHPELRVTADRIAGQPAAALTAAAEEAGLLVIGSRGIGRVAGFIVGSVALAVLARAERPVVLVRTGGRAEDEHLPDATGTPSSALPRREVVLGLDLVDPDDAVMEFAFDAARRRAAVLRVVHGWSVPPSYGDEDALDTGLDAGPAVRERRGPADVLEQWKDKFPDVEVRTQSVVGGAGAHLVDASREAALVVVGRRIRRAPVGSHIGPVTHEVLHHASAPVAVIPHD
ncbi:universal stress protein [Streptomyces sp. NBC_00481]|uniref:universal stress protein n=1 Tax=Streptomyces sp. NBC_00481 TaxID=2975755 RepID=UPI002DDBBAB5|nr:universal stress protein [Streptomyces sp. NBC_00481]WRZ00242.1 universal stress protein [Streptomyces sp. NBC_00481]